MKREETENRPPSAPRSPTCLATALNFTPSLVRTPALLRRPAPTIECTQCTPSIKLKVSECEQPIGPSKGPAPLSIAPAARHRSGCGGSVNSTGGRRRQVRPADEMFSLKSKDAFLPQSENSESVNANQKVTLGKLLLTKRPSKRSAVFRRGHTAGGTLAHLSCPFLCRIISTRTKLWTLLDVISVLLNVNISKVRDGRRKTLF